MYRAATVDFHRRLCNINFLIGCPTTNMLPGYLRKNGVPYSDKAVLTEYYNRLSGQQNDSYIALTATAGYLLGLGHAPA